MRHTGAPTPQTLEWTFGDRLRKVRRDVAQLGQEEFAAELNVSLKAYSAWEAGRNVPRELVALAKRIELVTGVPAAWMLGIEERIAVPAMTGTDGVTQRVTSQYYPGNAGNVIQFPQAVTQPSGYRRSSRGDRRGRSMTGARQSRRRSYAEAAV